MTVTQTMSCTPITNQKPNEEKPKNPQKTAQSLEAQPKSQTQSNSPKALFEQGAIFLLPTKRSLNQGQKQHININFFGGHKKHKKTHT